ncbi:MAG: lytic transglycosylase domain-containing protein [Deltaproteobacteria bacterium]|nr:lytic transglycosylase domain-containing protein [Deltaproteobacteria bacterium]
MFVELQVTLSPNRRALSSIILHCLLGILIAITLVGCSVTKPQIADTKPGAIKVYPDLPLIDNEEVRYFISYYKTTGKSFLLASWKRQDEFGGQVEDILRSHGIPRIFLSLATVESGFRPEAKSPCGAAGLWQFMPATAEKFGLRVGLFHDDRYNVESSTSAAARYLKELHDKFGDWYLALAAYNAGPARIKSVLKANNAHSYFELSRLGVLSTENTEFVAKVVAVATISENPGRYGFQPKL